ncbi:MAG TPA: SET domain-containing protein-lysine N-methyltransferase [Pseudonocardiaceae bacterium]
MPTYLPRTWFDPRLALAPSDTDGQGIVARAPFAVGEVVMIWGGTLYSAEDLAAGRVPRGVSYSIVADGQVLAGPADDLDYYLNHSCDPNVWMADEVTMTARRPIAAGEEVRIDYALVESEPDYEIPVCRCGATPCRGRITGGDWRRDDLQERYAGHFLPFLNRAAPSP